jgi:RNA polymerase sigma factor (sigma-70 family)
MSIDACKRTDRQLLGEFATGRDEEAFAELVRRHGPMVLGVCRQLLRHEQNAEDAFQATFLVLARKAGSIRSPEALPNWLFGVATRMATRQRTLAGRRQAREVPLVDSLPTRPEAMQPRAELWSVLCEEIGRLPERYRIPFILCYLDGETNEEAGRQLKIPAGTVFSRLARARKRLRERLVRRGIAISPVLFAATLAKLPRDLTGDVSAELLAKTVRNATLFAAGRVAGTAGVCARVLVLAEHGIRFSNAARIKAIVATFLSTALIGTGSGVLLYGKGREKTMALQVQGSWVMESWMLAGDPSPFRPTRRSGHASSSPNAACA